MSSPDVYLLLHTFKEGESENVFHFYPDDENPYPDICAVAEKLLEGFYKPGEDSLQLLGPIHSVPDMEFLPTDRVGTRVWKEFHEGPLVPERQKEPR
jgi:hypothetical protein